MKNKSTQFQIYRYQILPITRQFQRDFFDNIKDLEDLLRQKNKIFGDVLKTISLFNTEKAEITHKIEFEDKDFLIYRFNVSRKLDRETKDFRHEPVDTWPSFFVAIWNAPDKQYVIVEKRFAAFQHTDTVVRHLCDLINETLIEKNLRVHWESLFEEQVFWDIIKDYKGRIEEIRFELVTPNMANISGTVADELKILAKSTNSATTSVELTTDPKSSLVVDPENQHVAGLVEYSSKGGGNIAIKIKGIRHKIQTSKSVKTIEIDEIEAQDPKTAAAILKRLLDQ
jgi:hypothetical protein